VLVECREILYPIGHPAMPQVEIGGTIFEVAAVFVFGAARSRKPCDG